MGKILLFSVIFMAIAVLLLALKLLIKGDSRGPMTHIGASKAMHQRGIHCVESMDAMERREYAQRHPRKDKNTDKSQDSPQDK